MWKCENPTPPSTDLQREMLFAVTQGISCTNLFSYYRGLWHPSGTQHALQKLSSDHSDMLTRWCWHFWQVVRVSWHWTVTHLLLIVVLLILLQLPSAPSQFHNWEEKNNETIQQKLVNLQVIKVWRLKMKECILKVCLVRRHFF